MWASLTFESVSQQTMAFFPRLSCLHIYYSRLCLPQTSSKTRDHSKHTLLFLGSWVVGNQTKIGLPPGVLWKKAARAMRAMRGNGLEALAFQLHFACAESFLEVLSNRRFQARRPMRAKEDATVPFQAILWVPLEKHARSGAF